MPQPTTGILDDFNRANEGPPPSANWTSNAGENGLVTDTNTLKNSLVGFASASYNTVFGPDQEFYMDLTTLGTALKTFYMNVRKDAAADNRYILEFRRLSDGTHDRLTVFKRIAGVETAIGAQDLSTTFANGDGIMLQVIGSNINVWRRASGVWTQVLTRSNTEIIAGGKIDIAVEGNSWVFDNVGGGSISPSITPVPGRVVPIRLSRFHRKLFAFPPIPPTGLPATTQFIDITAAAETNTAQALSFTKTIFKTLGVTVITHVAQALNVDKLKTLGVALEADAAQAFTKFKSKVLGVATETDSARPLSITKTIFKTLGVTSEADVAQAITKYKSKTLGVTTQTNTAQPFTRFKSKLLGVATETDAAQALTKYKLKILIPATETDVAQVLSITHGGGPQFKTLTPATESDIAQALNIDKYKTLGVATESDVAQAIIKSKRVTIIAALETDAAQALIHLKRLGIAAATETDAAVALTKYKSKTLGIAAETDAARPLVFTKTIRKTLTPAQEFDVAVPLTIAGQEVVIVYKYRGPITFGRF